MTWQGGNRLACSLLALLLSLLPLPTLISASAGADQPLRRIVLVIADGLSWSILESADLRNLRGLAARGSIGLMNVRTPGQSGPGAGHLTLASGTRLAGAPSAGLVLEAAERLTGEPPGDQLLRTTGGQVPPGGAAFLALPQAGRLNQEAAYPFQLGALAGALAGGGILPGAVGNSDRPEIPNRPGAILASDSRGVIPLARLSGLNQPDPAFPMGIRSDYRAYLSAIDGLLPHSRFLVVELGDLSRLDHPDQPMLSDKAREAAQLVASEVDRFLGDLARRIDPRQDLLILTVPTPAQESLVKGDLLNFTLFWGTGFPPGLLHSSGTRRPGILANTDLAPTIIDLFGLVPPRTMVGRTVVGGATFPGGRGTTAWDYLITIHHRAAQVQAVRAPILKTFVILELAAVVGFLVGIRLAPELVPRLYPALVFLTAVPLGLLFWPGWWLPPVWGGLSFILITGLLAGLALWIERRRPLGGLLALCGLTWGTITADTLTGSRLMLISPLSYSPSGGARYYGIGNEYLGVFIGSTLVLASLLWDRSAPKSWLRLSIILGLSFSAGLLAWPEAGANFGGFMAAVAGFGATVLGLAGLKIDRRFGIWLALLTLFSGAAVVASDLARPEPSYIGRAFLWVAEGGAPALSQIIERKISMNLRLIRYTNWTLVFIVSIIALVYLAWRPGGFLARVASRRPALKAGLAGLVVGSLAALVLNDSGIVAAATLLLYAKAPLAALWLEEENLTRRPMKYG